MTTVVACRKTGRMIADSKCSAGSTAFRTRKICKVKGKLVGVAGNANAAQQFLDWLKGVSDAPDEGEFEAVVLGPDGITYYNSSKHPISVDEDYLAIGTGEDAVRAVMETRKHLELDYDPVFAVAMACLVDNFSGQPIDILELKPKRKRAQQSRSG